MLGGADEVGLEEEAAVGILSAHMTEEPLIVRGGLEHERLRVSLRARTRARARKPAPRIIQGECTPSTSHGIRHRFRMD